MPPPGAEKLNHAGWWAARTIDRYFLERDEDQAADLRRVTRRDLEFVAMQRWLDDPASRFWALGAGAWSETPVNALQGNGVLFEIGFPAVLRPETLPQRADGSFDWEAYQATAYPTGVPVTLDPSVPPRCSAVSDPLPGRPEEHEVHTVTARTIGDALKVWAADPRSMWWVPRGYEVEVVSGGGAFDGPRASEVRVRVRLRLESLVDRPASSGSLSADWTRN